MSEAAVYAGDALVVAGTLVLTIAVVGLARFRGTNARIHAAAEAVLGVQLGLLACVFGGAALAARALLVALFLVVTAPVSAHALARLKALRSARSLHERPRS